MITPSPLALLTPVLFSESTDFAASQDPSHGSMREPILKIMNLMRSMEYETDIPTPTSNGYSTQRTHITRLWNIVEKIGNGPHDFPSVFGTLVLVHTVKSVVYYHSKANTHSSYFFFICIITQDIICQVSRRTLSPRPFFVQLAK